MLAGTSRRSLERCQMTSPQSQTELTGIKIDLVGDGGSTDADSAYMVVSLEFFRMNVIYHARAVQNRR